MKPKLVRKNSQLKSQLVKKNNCHKIKFRFRGILFYQAITMDDKIKKTIYEFRLLLALVLISLGAAIFLLAYYFVTENKFDWQSDIIHQTGPLANRLIDGKLVATEKSALKPITITLENHIDSRPIAGLEYASIIYETIVEGDITRFLAIFDGDIAAKKIGPIRSARPFFVDLIEEWDPIYFHAGGSLEALDQLKASSIVDINEISGDGIYFWRDNNRTAPHNLFTSANLIKRVITAKEISMVALFSPWRFKSDQPASINDLVQEVKVDFYGNPFYQVSYQYNQDNNDYIRYLAGKVHKTDRGIILKAKNIVLQFVLAEIIDSYGRLDINLKSGGQAKIYQDGREILGSWKKTNGRTRFYDQDRKEIEFNQGSIWVELVFE